MIDEKEKGVVVREDTIKVLYVQCMDTTVKPINIDNYYSLISIITWKHIKVKGLVECVNFCRR
jgi:hypothetical protein